MSCASRVISNKQLRLGLAARELYRGHRLLSDGESQTPPGFLAAEIEIRRAVAGRGSQGVLAAAPAASVRDPRRRRVFPRQSPAPTARRCSAWPAACGCSRAAPCRHAARHSASSASATAVAPRRSSSAASRRYRRSAASTWSLRERPACRRPPAAPKRAVSRFSIAVWQSSCSSEMRQSPRACSSPIAVRASRIASKILRRQAARCTAAFPRARSRPGCRSAPADCPAR